MVGKSRSGMAMGKDVYMDEAACMVEGILHMIPAVVDLASLKGTMSALPHCLVVNLILRYPLLHSAFFQSPQQRASLQ
jgi:hypothetical protein